MAVNKVIYGETTVIDITDSTVTASNLKSGETAYGANGQKVTGTLVVPEVLDDLSDVVITTPQTAQEIYFDGTNWINYGAKIVLTFDDDFKGQTITLTKGQTTITKTAPLSGNTMNLYVNETGTWTISSEISEITYETEVNVTTFGTSFDAELSSVPPIPEGATVTPTDDIQIWLACANLDKPYTTLAEVLADRETFETLISDSNACDYMARSTTWAGSKNSIVPIMTSNTTPSGEVKYVGTNLTATSSAYKAFIQDNSQGGGASFNDRQNIKNFYIEYDFKEPKTVTGASMYQVGYNLAGVTGSWVVEASNNENEWELISNTLNYSQTTPIGTAWTITNSSAYRYYRIRIISDTEAYTGMLLYNIQLFFDGVQGNQDAMSLIGKYDYCSNALLGNSVWAEAIANSDYFEEVLNVKVPVMTSDTTPSGVAYALPSNAGSGYEAYRAFDGNSSTMSAVSGTLPRRLGYHFTQPINVKKVVAYSNYATTKGILRASNDNLTWKEIKILNHDSQTKEYIITENSEAFTYWEIESTQEYGWGSFDMYSLQFYGRASNEVLVPLVPTMTSNTTPSGEVVYGSVYSQASGYEAFRVFDRNTSTRWNNNGTTANDYIGYKFDNPVVINKCSILPFYDSQGNLLKDFKVQGSNTGNSDDWHDVSEVFTLQNINYGSTSAEFSFDNSESYIYYVIRCLNNYRTSAPNNFSIYEIQFYQRTVQTNIIHSCANDTIYYMDNGSPVIVATTNSDGDGILDFSSLEDKEYTFYSSVAKDPSNLSNDFSKTIRIAKSKFGGTTEMYLMPDAVKTLYWWGYVGSNLEDVSSVNGWTFSYTMQTPTHNANEIDLSTSSGSVTKGIGSKESINANKIHGIVQSTGTSGNLSLRSSKNFTTATSSLLTSLTTGLNHIQSIEQSSSGYMLLWGTDPQTLKCKALWYE